MKLLLSRRQHRRVARIAIGAALTLVVLWAGAGSALAIGTLDQSNPGLPFSESSFGGTGELGQTFKAGLTGSLDTAEVAMCKVGNPGDLVVKIEGTHKDLVQGDLFPVDSDVLATQTIPASSVVAPTCPDSAFSFSTVQISFDSPASIQAGTTYALVLSSPSTTSYPDNRWTWGTDLGGYANGSFCFGSSGSWGFCDGSTDAVFATYVTPIPPQVGVSPSSLSFGNQPVGATSTPQTITITNTAGSGGQSLSIGTLSTGGANPGDFTLSNDNCSSTSVAAGSSCSVDVSFAPTVSGSRGATLVVPSNAASSPDTVPLSGTGTPTADVSLTMTGPSSAKRGIQLTYSITVANAGPSTAHNVVISDPFPAGSKFVGVSTSSGTCTHSDGTINCSLGDLAAGGSAGSAVNIKIIAKVGSTITNLASAYSTANNFGPATFDPNTANNWQSLSTTIT